MSEHDQGDPKSEPGDAERVEILTDAGPGDDKFSRGHAYNADAGRESQFPSWLIWIAGLIVINVLSAVFNWGFWLY